MFVEKPYISTHVHTDMSNIRLPDCINKINDVIDYALTLGLRGIAITDHECLSNHVKGELYLKDLKKKAKKILEGDNNSPETIEKCKRVLDFRLLLGNEIYLVRNGLTKENRQKGEKFHHFILIAKDLEGHKQLRELSTRAWSRSYKQGIERVFNYYSDLEDVIKPNPGHLIATTACLGGFLGEHVLKFGRTGSEESEKAIDGFIRRMVGLFGDDFYLEMQPSLNSEQIFYNKSLMQLSQKYNVPLIIATDAHYLRAEDRPIHKAYLNSKQGEREVDDFYSSTYLMSSSEMWFKYMDTYVPQTVFEEALENTLRIGEKCEEYSLYHPQEVPLTRLPPKEEWDKDLEVPFGGEAVKKFANSPHDQDRYLLYRVKKGMEEKIPKSNWGKYWNRIEYEFDILWFLSEKLGERLGAYSITVEKIIELIWTEGDSLVGPARGSAAGFLTNYLIGVTQVDPLAQEMEMPAWRFLNKERVELPDIDVDTQGSKRERILQVIYNYFTALGGDVINVATFGTEGAKSALNTACRSLGYEPEYGLYLSSMVPSERGQTWDLHDCYYGNEEKGRSPVQTFVNEMNAHPDIWEVAQGIEGLVKQRGIHASGVLIFNGPAQEMNAVMRAPNGTKISQFELHDSEYLGGLKFDLLTVECLDKIRTCMDLLVENGHMEWQGSLRATYDKYLHPSVIDYKTKDMWKMAHEGEIVDLFQFETAQGRATIQATKPTSLTELAISNSLMRLMSDVGGRTPMETFVHYKEDINEWFREMDRYNLAPSEQQILKEQLLKRYGVAESQESIMLLSIHPKIANFTIGEANALRKAVAKKNPKVLEEVKTLFFEKGRKAGTSENMLRYVWEVQIGRQIGYSFSQLHTVAYSIIAVQEMNLAYHFPVLYWNTACLTVNAGAQEDLFDEDEVSFTESATIIEEVNEDDAGEEDDDDEEVPTKEKKKIKTRSTNYGKISAAIGAMQSRGIQIDLPDINYSQISFTPDEINNRIVYGIKGITRIGDELAREIIANRPYKSMEDFLNKVKINKTQMINLIKAGAFDALEKKPREMILRSYIKRTADLKKRVTLQNMNMLIDRGLVPEQYILQAAVYKFNKYIKKYEKDYRYYTMNDSALEFYNKVGFNPDALVAIGESICLKKDFWEQIYRRQMDIARGWIRENSATILEQLNNSIFQEAWEKYGKGNISRWEMESVSFYYNDHELANVNRSLYEISNFFELPTEPQIESTFTFKGRTFPRFHLTRIIGTVLDKNQTRNSITLLTPEGVVTVKIWKPQFVKYNKQISGKDPDTGKKKILEKSWFSRGTKLMITGFRRGDQFVPKIYSKHKYTVPFYRIDEVNEDGTLVMSSERAGEEN